MKRRLLIFGIDGGTFQVLEPLLAAGRLPNLARMRAQGAAGTLLSVVPPLTAPAWGTFLTGLNPGRHGVFDFLAPPRLGYNRALQNATALAAPRILDALSAVGRTVGAVNVPLTYPPRPVNGFVIPGLLTPAAQDRYYYPRSIGADVRHAGEYFIDMNPRNFEEGHDDDFLEDLSRVAEARKHVALALWRERRPDLFVVVFTGVDRLMHFFWDRPALVAAHYEWLDAALGEFWDAADDEVTTIVMSDHGFGPVAAEADLGAHLIKHGFLHLKKRGGPSPRRIMDIIAAIDILKLRRRLPSRLRAAARGRVMANFSAFSGVDWNRTTAFPGTATQYGLYLNVAGREPRGAVARADYERVRDEVVASLDDLHAGLAARALRREEIYHGPALDDAPDLYLPLWEDGVRLKEFSDDPAVAPRRARPGEHRREGIFFAAGPAFAAGSTPRDAALADIYPTAMYVLGEAVPANVDGRLLREVLEPGLLAEAPPNYHPYGGGESGYVAEEDAAVRARLEGMGYLG